MKKKYFQSKVKIMKHNTIGNWTGQGKKTLGDLNQIKGFLSEFIGEIKDEAIPLIIEEFKIEFKLK